MFGKTGAWGEAAEPLLDAAAAAENSDAFAALRPQEGASGEAQAALPSLREQGASIAAGVLHALTRSVQTHRRWPGSHRAQRWARRASWLAQR